MDMGDNELGAFDFDVIGEGLASESIQEVVNPNFIPSNDDVQRVVDCLAEEAETEW